MLTAQRALAQAQEEAARQVAAGQEQTRAQLQARIARIRNRLLAVGIPASIAGGVLTTLIFAVAFKMAKTPKAWTPALILGGATAVAGLARVTVAATSVAALERELEEGSQGAPMAAITPSMPGVET